MVGRILVIGKQRGRAQDLGRALLATVLSKVSWYKVGKLVLIGRKVLAQMHKKGLLQKP